MWKKHSIFLPRGGKKCGLIVEEKPHPKSPTHPFSWRLELTPWRNTEFQRLFFIFRTFQDAKRKKELIDKKGRNLSLSKKRKFGWGFCNKL